MEGNGSIGGAIAKGVISGGAKAGGTLGTPFKAVQTVGNAIQGIQRATTQVDNKYSFKNAKKRRTHFKKKV